MVHASPPQGLLKIDVDRGTEESWIGTPDEYLGECIFAPKKNSSMSLRRISSVCLFIDLFDFISLFFNTNLLTDFCGFFICLFLYLLFYLLTHLLSHSFTYLLIFIYVRFLSIYSVLENEAREDDGYVLSFLSNWKAGKSYFVIFDARNISKGIFLKIAVLLFRYFCFFSFKFSFSFLGPIYKSKLSVALPSGLHGTYVNGLVYEQNDIIKVCHVRFLSG